MVKQERNILFCFLYYYHYLGLTAYLAYSLHFSCFFLINICVIS